MIKFLYHVYCADCILGPEFTSHEPTTTNNCNPIFGRRFGILLEHNNDVTFHAQTVSNCELMLCYSIDIKPVVLRTNNHHSNTILDNLITFGLTWRMWETLLTTYCQNQEYQTLLHMLPEKLIRQHNFTSHNKALILQFIGRQSTYQASTLIP